MTSSASVDRFDVAVLGLGPVGCMAALLLASRGLSVVAVERDQEVYRLPRAVNLDGEVVRAVQPLGLADELNALLQPVREGERVGFANSRREWLFGNDAKAFGANGWQPMNMFDQPELEGWLRARALAQPGVTAYVGHEATGFEDHGDGVTLELTGPEGVERLAARYLLACDGASSPTRKRLGIGWHDLGYNHDWLVVDIITRPGHRCGHTTLQVCDPDRITTYVCTKDPYRRWEFKLNEGETWEEMLEPERIAALIEAWTPAGTYEVRRAAMYQFHAATADRWRVGRVFIAGDAAHQTPPFLGQGMNAGLRDVINFAWKLPLVIQGVADDALLDSYQAERDAHAHDLVEWAVAIGRLMEHLAAVEAAERAGEAPPETPPQLKASGYGQGREQPPLRAGVFMTDQLDDSSPVGYLFAQPIVQGAQGTGRLDELLGPGFAVVGRQDADLELSEDAKALLQRLGARCLSLEGLKAVKGHFDRGFEQFPAMIVRPDRYVFGVVDAGLSLDDLVRALGEKLALITPTNTPNSMNTQKEFS
jgi:2-polyprenyl-6-methoxyphenol hydroxylase-like FAD-dependent oxidoreductase